MPSAIRYARALTARRSPRARLYSAVPRSSQWPSIVTVQVPYFLSRVAFSFSVCCASGDSSSLSNSKNTGLSGEFLFRSSSEAVAIASSRTGSGGTIVGSEIGGGGDGGRGAGVVVPVAVGAGRTTGGGFLWHATPPTSDATAITKTVRLIVV